MGNKKRPEDEEESEESPGSSGTESDTDDSDGDAPVAPPTRKGRPQPHVKNVNIPPPVQVQPPGGRKPPAFIFGQSKPLLNFSAGNSPSQQQFQQQQYQPPQQPQQYQQQFQQNGPPHIPVRGRPLSQQPSQLAPPAMNNERPKSITSPLALNPPVNSSVAEIAAAAPTVVANPFLNASSLSPLFDSYRNKLYCSGWLFRKNELDVDGRPVPRVEGQSSWSKWWVELWGSSLKFWKADDDVFVDFYK